MSKKKRHMLIRYTQVAKYPGRTHEKGYWSNPDNFQWDELVDFSLGLKNRDKREASVILDIDSRMVVKNRMSTEKDFDLLYSYYEKHYSSQIEDYLKRTNHLVE